MWVRIPPRAFSRIMPELPEVEIQVRQLRRKLRGSKILHVDVRDQKLRLPSSLIGRRIERVWRRGKFIIFDLDDDRHLLAHLRMTGWFEFREPRRYRAAIVTSRGTAFFEDSRRFGVLAVVKNLDAIHHLGPEPFADFELPTKRPVKVALLDQRLVAGIGNIYASESLWRAGIHPRRQANRLSAAEFVRLRKGIAAALRQGIGYGPRIFTMQQFAVYERVGKPCRRCGTPIRRIVQAQRSTVFCPGCQH